MSLSTVAEFSSTPTVEEVTITVIVACAPFSRVPISHQDPGSPDALSRPRRGGNESGSGGERVGHNDTRRRIRAGVRYNQVIRKVLVDRNWIGGLGL